MNFYYIHVIFNSTLQSKTKFDSQYDVYRLKTGSINVQLNIFKMFQLTIINDSRKFMVAAKGLKRYYIYIWNQRVAASVQKIQFELSMFISLLETIKNMSNYNLLIKADLRLIHKYGTKASQVCKDEGRSTDTDSYRIAQLLKFWYLPLF